MPDIEFKDLNKSIGTELFADSESFLEDLSEDAANIAGGFSTGVATITLSETSVGTTVARPPHPTLTTTIYIPPHPGGNSGINCTGLYTTGIGHLFPRHPRPIHPRPIHPTFTTNDA